MIQIFKDPFLADFLYVASKVPKDEREQIEAMTGDVFSVDGAAVGNFVVPGPKWVIKIADSQADFDAGNSIPLVVGGFVPQRPGVWRDFLLTTSLAWDYSVGVTRFCKKAMDAMLDSGQAHRLECVVPLVRVESRPELPKWYKLLGYHEEGIRHGYCANGADAMAYARVKH